MESITSHIHVVVFVCEHLMHYMCDRAFDLLLQSQHKSPRYGAVGHTKLIIVRRLMKLKKNNAANDEVLEIVSMSVVATSYSTCRKFYLL